MPRELQCELCGDSFLCGKGSGKCWCTDIKVSAEALHILRGLASDCVCPNCLNKFTQR
ncbi:MAG: cysteine-rich CWC family protein [Candidatus Bathyarchaeia archaeon]